MAQVKIKEGGWKGQEGEFVRNDDLAGTVVVRMPGNRVVEFAPERVEFVVDEPEAKAADAE